MTVTDEPGPSIQERYFAELTCFGCGPRNAKGLRLRSYPIEGPSVRTVGATFMPWPEHGNGLGYLNGGIIATLLDCHSAAAMILASDDLGLSSTGTLPYVTAGIDVRYRRPSPLHDAVELIGRITSADEDQVIVDTELWWQDKVRASATALWKRWRPRPEAVPPTSSH